MNETFARYLDDGWVSPKWGSQPTTLSERLEHTLRGMDGVVPPNSYAVVATMNLYGPGVMTGITWQDLRDLAEMLNERKENSQTPANSRRWYNDAATDMLRKGRSEGP